MSVKELLAQIADPRARGVNDYRRTRDSDLDDRRLTATAAASRIITGPPNH